MTVTQAFALALQLSEAAANIHNMAELASGEARDLTNDELDQIKSGSQMAFDGLNSAIDDALGAETEDEDSS